MADFEMTRWAGSDWEPMVRGQRVTVTHGDFTGEFQVTEVTPNPGGGETYALQPAPPPGQPIGDLPSRGNVDEYCFACGKCPCTGGHLGPAEAMIEGFRSGMQQAAEDIRAAHPKVAEAVRKALREDHG